MASQTSFPPLQGYRFSDSQKAQLLATLKRIRFSGQLVWTASNGEQKWLLYFCLGRIIYATGGNHPVRRWARSLATCCTQMPVDITQLRYVLREFEPNNCTNSWEYQLFCLWVEQQRITQEQAEEAILLILSEVLFDVSQAQTLTHHIKEESSISKQLVLINEQQAIEEVQRLWQKLWNAKITEYSLDKAPIIKQPKQLQENTSAKVYHALTQLLDGKNTLRDLAVKTQREVVQVQRSLLPYLKSGLVELISIPDLPDPFCQGVPDLPSLKQDNSNKPLIACVDDSVSICQTMEKLMTAAGYRFIGINDGLRALTMLLIRKPDLIFLDLVMPNTNGYEICRQLRKAPSFRETPIVILTGNDGIVDQVRAKLVGASSFLSKPVDAQKVLSVIYKHLSSPAISTRRIET
ncbi:MAG: response regulator [Symploca sp. SIO3C6]|uniref:Response regulator n=1 Tax=Symploca sp. SIO1C4 TaxID=2607765 RepID=A0A6B3NJD0_9CYAN|nr:response regulator [Symploca sp. SIO3C6]NER29298.1 response regulator [Symploca sp. SIO1C4]